MDFFNPDLSRSTLWPQASQEGPESDAVQFDAMSVAGVEMRQRSRFSLFGRINTGFASRLSIFFARPDRIPGLNYLEEERARYEEELGSPKSLRGALPLPNFSSTELNLPFLSRPLSRASIPSSHYSTDGPYQPQLELPLPARVMLSTSPRLAVPTAAPGCYNSTVCPPGTSAVPRIGRTPGQRPETRPRQRGEESMPVQRRPRAKIRRFPRSRPRRFLLCFPWVDSRRVRSLILQCFVSGLFLAIFLSTYLGLCLTKDVNANGFTVALILVILCATIVFCHGLVRLCIVLAKRARERASDVNQTQLGGGSEAGFSIPRKPIQVVLVGDEAADGCETAATIKPPAYGVWRESVRLDPSRLFWQRNMDPDVETLDRYSEPHLQSIPRPPSYVSDDGISYVMDAVSRSTVTNVDVPLHSL